MGVREVNKYYDQITKEYTEMIEILKELEDSAAEKVIAQEEIDNVKEIIAPLKQNFQRISYIMYLLNMPNKRTKQGRYKKQNKKFLNEKCDKTEIKENKEVLEKLMAVEL